MERWRLPRQAWSFVLFALLSTFAGVSPAHAQPPPSNPNEMCGNGETFSVHLPGTTLGITDSDGTIQDIDAPNPGPDDDITLPKGCRIYAFFISGFGDNEEYDRIIFYKVAEFVARNNGYVHVGWWNNLTAPYMERPLHPATIIVRRPLGLDQHIPPTPRAPGIPDEFVVTGVDLPKANPDDDFQFVSDMKHVLKAVRAHNKHALIIVAGHSMGGNAIVRVAAEDPGVPMDLLAPIDPVGNRDLPRGAASNSQAYNWTRWRATRIFRGWKVQECVPSFAGGCFVAALTSYFKTFQCQPVIGANWLSVKPVIGSRTPLACPGPYEDKTGAPLTIGTNVGYFYHRWQNEAKWPLDFPSDLKFHRPTVGWSTTDILSRNYQVEVFPNTSSVVNDPNKTCSQGIDPRDSNYQCSSIDGHGELVGVRRQPLNLPQRPGLALANWPPRSSPIPFFPTLTSEERRERLVQLAVDGPNWQYRPENPNLCLVCDDMITITQHLMSKQVWPPPASTGGDLPPNDLVPPASQASLNPETNELGWANEDVLISVNAIDARPVIEEVHLTLSGAHTGATTTPGSTAEAIVSEEGLTQVSYFARDGAGNNEAPQTLEIRIDKTSPIVYAHLDILPNAHEWLGSPVTISFTASDEPSGSGIAGVSADESVTTEGSLQEIFGSAEDNAGNAAVAVVTLNIDLTPPAIAPGTRVPPANAAGWNNSPVAVTWNCTDALSSVLAPADAATIGSEGAGQSAMGTCRDKADHVTTDTLAGINIDMTPPAIAPESPVPAANAAGWNNTAVTLSWNCTDALSGPVDPTVSASIATEGTGQSRTGQCVDAAQNTANHTQAGVNIDVTNPAAILAAPANGASYLLNATVAADFGCTDALSGIGSCAGTLPVGSLLDTSSVGAKMFTVAATDVAANSLAVTHAYSIRYNFSGFALPIRPEVNRVNAGRTVPVKFSLRDANSVFVANLAAFASLTSAQVACDSGEAIDLEGEIDGSGQETIRYDADANQFVYNWKTESTWAGSCRALTLALADGSEHVARFRFQ